MTPRNPSNRSALDRLRNFNDRHTWSFVLTGVVAIVVVIGLPAMGALYLYEAGVCEHCREGFFIAMFVLGILGNAL